MIDYNRARRLPGAALSFFIISTLAKGVYFLKIGTDRATIMRKIVVE
ncbi:MAG: T9SS type A sorting domain-containing protein [Bacteroidales bacterium]|nr:T9SS type A sorting domain-containing protein [Bacteroidales bacterium]